jgi:8-oxo-dGTP pyrophosphatase MutT (NUDIX family)
VQWAGETRNPGRSSIAVVRGCHGPIEKKHGSRVAMSDDIRAVGSREVYANRWLRLREDVVRYRDGSDGVFSVVEKNDFAVVLPWADGGFWLVEQYRYAVGRREWEFPQGGWPPGRDGSAEELAASELVEETGLRASRFEHLGRLNSAPGYAANAFDVFLATGLTEGAPRREATEADMVHGWFAEAAVHAMIRQGEFRDSNSVAALTLLQLRRSDPAAPMPPGAA